jgi:phosphatidate cytidylyltransferase
VTETPTKTKSDLSMRTVSAIVMIGIAGTALWAGGIWFDLFAIAIGIICFAEFVGLVLKMTGTLKFRLLLSGFGLLYIGLAFYLITEVNSVPLLLLIIGSVVCVDTFAYFFGRTLGGPKIAPKLSPSKTWAGLLGGIFGATLALILYFKVLNEARSFDSIALSNDWLFLLGYGVFIAVLAQAGDFFESWLKRKAGVKDSSRLIPGHGGVFDRVDGMLPIAIAVGILLVQFYPHWLNS